MKITALTILFWLLGLAITIASITIIVSLSFIIIPIGIGALFFIAYKVKELK